MRIVVSGGGTGGHIYPALAMIREIERRTTCEVLYIGTENGLEADIVRRAGIPFEAIEISGLRRSLSFENVKTGVRFVKSVVRVRKLLRQFKPDIVVGTGGFVCGPVLYTAAKMGYKTVVHEQNSLPGITNKFLARYVDRVALSFKGSGHYFGKNEAKTMLIGNPRASEVAILEIDPVEERKKYGFEEGRPLIVVYGGSRGAPAINQAVVEMIPKLTETDWSLLFVTGQVHYEQIKNQLGELPERIQLRPFIYDLPLILKASQLVVSRSGASTLAELTTLGLPSVLIPSPYVTENHQEVNASSLVETGASLLIRENELTGDRLFAACAKAIAEQKAMSQASLALGMPDAASDLVDELLRLIEQKN
ncbi:MULTISPECIES: undecaprenyldiphospho-muramoylpentapeptide beta-N-acetylglucosaminyltransferase [Exiguobacterium]|uniref:UDP-N-acetylglucosamine--N-acetylmuramyl-(pentapeptide) pyrophosphoryl-undecaprenol N-acetylglucosamine transferase n=1 Tax=Exiguobacterium antarcticum TaxID=132920 RepID=A0ABT6QYK2_9BACL|nr:MULTISPECIES: undecaprenyldiphospho-muramoylpentapeptide beta-N-acetylglucosaminyltransferase [Exiguobacterium]AFS70920.1 UDP-N-acetylglucosamine--N-acetylmuramyl-(pentapeptide) pyrophosphoryl-undecaprenol N-acetylglucosamine transferase [Exiguobacterium antarcticum B7]MCT4779095.1 undecaprenyldiphospho-muramoylpentapeptide beta-N-acetylglucosaminyltransferase [Exiguobacterium soli]MDI3233767.1 undecaprenyldiphospho-muramoylpentapeptide beta-N-acetylglucosaminyltransferase [Exiguobacterium an